MHFLARISFTFIRLNWGLVTPARTVFAIKTLLLLSGCASALPDRITADLDTRLVTQWHAPLPHNRHLTDINQCWAQFDYPLLLHPKTAADLASTSAAQGEMRLVQQQAQCDLLIKALTALTAQVERWPRITLSGNISANRIETGGISTDVATWIIGPVDIRLPFFDGGVRRIAAHIAVEGFEQSFQTTESSYQAGFASLFELEDARRSMINTKNTTTDLQRERIATWIALYREIGGGWTTAA